MDLMDLTETQKVGRYFRFISEDGGTVEAGTVKRVCIKAHNTFYFGDGLYFQTHGDKYLITYDDGEHISGTILWG